MTGELALDTHLVALVMDLQCIHLTDQWHIYSTKVAEESVDHLSLKCDLNVALLRRYVSSQRHGLDHPTQK